jgi:hypothetical protein
VFTEPDDLPEAAVAGALKDLWGFTAASLEYQPVGFGSYHWLAGDRTGRRVFVTADDLDAKLRTAADTADDALGRLGRAFGTALALRGEAGLKFVVAPLLTAAGRVVARLSERYSLVVHPYVVGTVAGEGGEFTNGGDRQTVVDMLIEVHRARVGTPPVDDFVVPNLDTLETMIRDPGATWRSGPYARRAQELLLTNTRGLQVLISAYRDLARRVSSQPERMVVTHGEPHAGNVMVTADGLVLVDWDTALLAPPERDLWGLAGDDASVLDHYAASTGTGIDDAALSLYRLWYDLSEVGGYLDLFRSTHEDTADTQESWKNLQHFLRPAERWPSLVEASRYEPDPL